ncbi:MAG TPA: addiction module protein [Arenimonas sp.]|nr:addiction module protein [Arenimonas sp.]
MSQAALKDLRNQALALDEGERAELAHALLLSLDGEPDADAAQQWQQEIERRLADLDAGKVELVDYDSLRTRLRHRIHDRE